jgi:prevent-host-death family protein
MTEVGAFQAKNRLGALLDRVEQGEEIVITRHGRPVARLVPNRKPGAIVVTPEARERARKAMEDMDAMRKELKPGRFNWEEFKAARDAGRK